MAVLIFFAFFDWEAITHLAEEFRDPVRDVPRSTLISVGIITVIARRLADGAGGAVGVVAAVIAVLIALGTANAFVAATSRLGYAPARDGAFPAPLARISTNGVPAISVVAVGGYAGLGVVVSYVAGWGPETLPVVPASLVIMTFLADLGTVLCLVLVPFSGGIVVIPAAVAVLAPAYRWWTGRRAEPRPEPDATAPAGQDTDEDLPVGTTPQE